MSDTPIWTIDLDDSAFRDFAETYKRFQEEADAAVSKWKASDDIIADALKNFEKMRAPEGLEVSAESADEIAHSFLSTSDSWGAIVARAKLFGGQVHNATLALGKWTGLTSTFSALLAAGGIWGINRMAAAAGRTRTAAAQLGTTYGRYEAAQSAFGRLGNVSGLMGGLAQGLHSAQGMGGLYSLMGGQADRLRGADTAEALAAILPRLKTFADSAPQGNLANRLSAMGLDKIGVTPELIRMLKTMSPAEVDEMVKTYRENKGRLELSGEAQLAMQEFTRQMDFAGAKMTTLMGENLSRLTPAVGRIAETFASVVEKMLTEGGPAVHALKWADEKIQRLAGWIDNPESMAAIRAFVADVDAAGRLFAGFTGGGSAPAQRFQSRPTVQADGTLKNETYEVDPKTGEASPAKPGHGRMMLKNPHEAVREGGFAPTVPAPAAGESVESVARRIQQVRPELESAQCVALAKAMVGSSASVRTWRRGENALSGNLQPGTPVATFMDRGGRPSDRYDAGGTGAPGNHTTHAAVFESYARDRGGKIAGMNVWEQYAGSGGPHRKFYPAEGGFGTRSASNYHAILDQNRRPLGRGNPMHPQLQGGVNHVEVDDQSSGGSRVSVGHMRIGPMRGPQDFHHAFAGR